MILCCSSHKSRPLDGCSCVFRYLNTLSKKSKRIGGAVCVASVGGLWLTLPLETTTRHASGVRESWAEERSVFSILDPLLYITSSLPPPRLHRHLVIFPSALSTPPPPPPHSLPPFTISKVPRMDRNDRHISNVRLRLHAVQTLVEVLLVERGQGKAGCL